MPDSMPRDALVSASPVSPEVIAAVGSARGQFSFFRRRSILPGVHEGPEFRRSYPSALAPSAANH